MAAGTIRAKRDLSYSVFLVVLALTTLGIVMVYSTSAIEADRRFGDATFFLRRQIVWTAIAGLALVLARTTSIETLLKWAPVALWFSYAVLVLVLFQPARGGAHRWLYFGSMQVQPSEAVKIVLIIYLAAACRSLPKNPSLRDSMRIMVAAGVAIGLVLIEPDVGTGLFLSVLTGVILAAGGVPIRHMLVVGAPAVVAGGAYALTRLDHVRTRIMIFLDPGASPLAEGYQSHQSLIALGSGGLSGLGLGNSRQKLFFLPEDHTDYILAIVGEELGFLGAVAILIAFMALVGFGCRIAWRCRERAPALVALGITMWLGLQAIINIGVVSATVSPKGISLPFVSYGGSALVMGFLAVGILMHIGARVSADEAALSTRGQP